MGSREQGRTKWGWLLKRLTLFLNIFPRICGFGYFHFSEVKLISRSFLISLGKIKNSLKYSVRSSDPSLFYFWQPARKSVRILTLFLHTDKFFWKKWNVIVIIIMCLSRYCILVYRSISDAVICIKIFLEPRHPWGKCPEWDNKLPTEHLDNGNRHLWERVIDATGDWYTLRHSNVRQTLLHKTQITETFMGCWGKRGNSWEIHHVDGVGWHWLSSDPL